MKAATLRRQLLLTRVATVVIVISCLGIAFDLPGFRGVLSLFAQQQHPTVTEIFVHDGRIDVRSSAPKGQDYVDVQNRSGDVVRIEYRDLASGTDPQSLLGATSPVAEKRIALPPLDPGEDWNGPVPDLRSGRYAILAVRVGADGALTVPLGAVSVLEVQRQADPTSPAPAVITTTMLVQEHVTAAGLALSTATFAGQVDLVATNDTPSTIVIGVARLPEGSDPASFSGRAVHQSELRAWSRAVASGTRWKHQLSGQYLAPGRYVLVAGTPQATNDLIVPAGAFAVVTWP